MTPILVLAGIPRFTLINAFPDFTITFGAGVWDIRRTDSEGRQPDFATCWKTLLTIIEEVERTPDHPGLHVLAFHKTDQTRKKFERRLSAFHRLRFLDTKYLRFFGSKGFNEYLDVVCDDEVAWRERLRPRHHSHPLILPDQFFTAPAALSDVWYKARTANSMKDVDIVSRMVKGFQRLRRSDSFMASDGLRFKYNVPPHGLTLQPSEHWKFAFRLPTGMQYDVESDAGNEPFTLMVNGDAVRFKNHANISPHNVIIAQRP